MRYNYGQADSALDVDSALLLADLMRDLSSECWCAGWMLGMEFDLWRMVCDGPAEWGFGDVTEQEVGELRRLSEKAGGWWVWDEGEKFVTTAEWLKILSERKAKP